MYKIKFVPLLCVFHSIRFKVNKVGVQRYSIFFALKSSENTMAKKCINSIEL